VCAESRRVWKALASELVLMKVWLCVGEHETVGDETKARLLEDQVCQLVPIEVEVQVFPQQPDNFYQTVLCQSL
jgi:hypothetical protein